MAAREAQARWRANDPKRTVELRLSAQAVARLDRFAKRIKAKGRAEAVERMLMADPGEHGSDAFIAAAGRIAQGYFEQGGGQSVTIIVKDECIEIRRTI